MTPEERRQFQEMQRMVRAMYEVADPAFIANLERRVLVDVYSTDNPPKLSDLSDVSGTDTASTGEVLKKTATTWQPGTDNIA